MPDDNLLATLDQSLRQARAARSRIAARLADIETEAEKLRTELSEMDALAGQTEAAMMRIMSSVLGASSNISSSSSPTDAQIEAALRHDAARAGHPAATGGGAGQRRHEMPPVEPHVEVISDRFFDRTIPQASAVLLREAGGPLHVNEIYNRLLEGNFQFTGQHPTISIAVSLNRNRRFRKVAPGTFDLVIRDAAQAS